MALQKQPVSLNFAQGVDTKTDSKQVQAGKFLQLQNSVFDKLGQLTKRNGYGPLAALPSGVNATNLNTLNGNLIATGANLQAYNTNASQWLAQGNTQPVQLSVIPAIRTNASQSAVDMAVAPGGSACLVYLEGGTAYYNVIDSTTGYQIIKRTAVASGSTFPRVFLLGGFFLITYLTASTLSWKAIRISSPTTTPLAGNFSASVSATAHGYDGIVNPNNNTFYIAYTDGGGTSKIQITALTSSLTTPYSGTAITASSTLMSLGLDGNNIYVSFYDGTNIYTAIWDNTLTTILGKTTIVSTATISRLTSSTVTAGQMTVIYENTNTYGFTPASGATVATNNLQIVTVTQAGTPTVASAPFLRGVALASKAIVINGSIYMVASFGETNQYTYFLIDVAGNVYMRLAATNGGGYPVNQILPTISLENATYFLPYQYADFLASVNTGQNGSSNQSAPINAIYTQTGINLAQFTLNNSSQYSSEIAGALHLTGGQLWEYDGVKPVEHGFQLFPSPSTSTVVANAAVTTSASGGYILADTYYYSFCYEWTDNQGNLHRSVPSLPISITTTSTTSTNTIYVPTLRLTYKTGNNPVRIVGYRWSTLLQTYYQFTSLTSPTLNDTTVDYVTFTDTAPSLLKVAGSPNAIVGNTILYTTGGVVENFAAPAAIASALFKNRLFLIDAEDRNVLWFSKQVIEATPVEFSDLFTLYIAPTSGAQGSTGPMTALSAMDDKLIIFKRDAIYYVTGAGPDNTGANNDYSDPIFITSSVGCANPSSIVLMPNGLMFQSDKGIWILGRDLNTSYIGAPVEQYNNNVVKSAISIPATNQVRFILDNSSTLMYDYFVGQWGVHTNLGAMGATLFQGEHTYLNTFGNVYQETPGLYLDGASPVLMSFTSAWINLAGLQGYERFYQMYLLGTYITPFKLNVQLAYNYNPAPQQNVLVSPDNFAGAWGSSGPWGGGGPWGGIGNTFEARIFPQIQKCESFQISVTEIYDPSYGVAAGQGLTLSGMNLVVGAKKGYRTQKAGRSFG